MKARLLVAALLLFWCGPSAAKPPPRKSAAAKQHYDAGIALYRAGKYEEAIAEFEAGYEIKPETGYLFNLGQASRLAHHPDKALEYYRKYLAEEPDAENRPAVEQRIAEVQRELDAQRTPAPAPPPPPPVPSVRPVAPAPVVAAPLKPLTPYELGVRVRGIFVSNLMLTSFLQAATSMESFSVGIEFVYHKLKYDIVTSLDFSYLDLHDGNYLANDHDPALDSHYLQFRDLSFLSADVSIIWHNELTSWLQIRYGVGLGIGVVLGDVLSTNDFGGCTTANVNNLAACHPVNVDLTSAQREQSLKMTEAAGAVDTADTPHRHVADKPPVMGVFNTLLGFRFKLSQHFSAQIEGGFRDAFFVGVGAHYRF